MDKKLLEELKEKTSGHAEIWECSFEEFTKKVIPVLRSEQLKNKLSQKVVLMAASFLRIKFDRKELKGTINNEVSLAIDNALMYYVNIKGEEV